MNNVYGENMIILDTIEDLKTYIGKTTGQSHWIKVRSRKNQ